MSREELIASGQLESFALDMLSKEEEVSLMDQVQNDELLKSQIQEAEATLDELSQILSVSPPANLKAKIMDQVKEPQDPEIPEGTKVINWRFISGMAASISFFAICTSIFLWSQFQTTAAERNQLLTEKQVLADNLSQTSLDLDSREIQIALYNHSETQIIDLKGTDNAPDASLRVFYLNGEVFLDLPSLPDLSEDQQFQLWAIVDGKPVDAGVFNVDEGFKNMKGIVGAVAFAVTIEPIGGSESPSLETMVVLGEV